MKIKLTAAERRKINAQIADTAKAQRRAVQALAADLERRKAAEQPTPFEHIDLEWDPDVLSALAVEPTDLIKLEWDPDILAALAAEPLDLHIEPVDLAGLFADNEAMPGVPVYIPIGEAHEAN